MPSSMDSSDTRAGDAQAELEPFGGALPAEISTALVQLYRRFYGRGPTRAKTIAERDVVTTVLEEILTTVERTLVQRGRRELVVEVRSTFQAAMAQELVTEVERITGRTVVSFTSSVDVDREVATETFVLAPRDEATAYPPVERETVRQADPALRDEVRARARETRSMSAAVRAQAQQAARQHARMVDRLAR